jgi:hypothetical protein
VGREAAFRAVGVKDTEAATSPAKVRREYLSMAAILGADLAVRNRDGRESLCSLVMKKILNRPLDYVNETLEGLCAAHPNYYRRTGTEGRVMVRPDAPIQGKVGIVTGGGSGHLPVFTGYLGPTLLHRYASRLRQVHVSEVNTRSTHEPLSYGSMLAFRQVAEFIPEHVPLILDTPVPEDQIESEIVRIRDALPVLALTA